MAQWARRITVDRLGERFPLDTGTRETGELVEAFNAMLARLDDAVGRLARFSADLAHEFKTPLANMLMQSQVMMSQTRSIAEYQGLVASNIEEVERLSRMVDNMLFLARAENEEVMLKRTPFDLHDELERIFERFYRGDPSRHSSAGSTGLGLAIVRSIAELHQGLARAWLDGSGVVVELALPAEAPQQMAGKTLIDAGEGAEHGAHPMEQAGRGMP